VYLYLLCFVLFVLCFLYCFVYVHLFLFVLSVLVKGLLPPSDNSIAVIAIIIKIIIIIIIIIINKCELSAPSPSQLGRYEGEKNLLTPWEEKQTSFSSQAVAKSTYLVQCTNNDTDGTSFSWACLSPAVTSTRQDM